MNALTCLPESLCSWDFRVLGASVACSVTFNFFTEQGGIALGLKHLVVRKHGPMSGHWTLEDHGQPVAEAHKPDLFFRTFEIQAGSLRISAQAQTPFTRSFNILCGGRTVGTIRPAHAFTRRAFIECSPEVSEACQIFAFWLAALTWRRQANNQ